MNGRVAKQLRRLWAPDRVQYRQYKKAYSRAPRAKQAEARAVLDEIIRSGKKVRKM